MTDKQKPIFYQYRTRPTNDDKHPWSKWIECTKSDYEGFLKTPVLHDWAYEARALYTRPAPDVVKELVEALRVAQSVMHGMEHDFAHLWIVDETPESLDLIERKIAVALAAAKEAGL